MTRNRCYLVGKQAYCSPPGLAVERAQLGLDCCRGEAHSGLSSAAGGKVVIYQYKRLLRATGDSTRYRGGSAGETLW